MYLNIIFPKKSEQIDYKSFKDPERSQTSIYTNLENH